MALRHRRRSRARNAAKSALSGVMKQVHKWLPVVSFESTFLGNAIDNINSQTSLVAKLKTIINAHTGKVTGINLFSDVPKFGVSVGLPDFSNPQFVSGATMLILGTIGKKFGIKHAGKLARIGADITIPAAIGTVFKGDVGVGAITSTPSITSGNLTVNP